MLRQQALVHWQHHFAAYLQRALQQQIQRPANRTFAGIFHRHHAVMGCAVFHRTEYIVNGCARLPLHRAAETREGSLLAERAFRPQISHRQRRLQRAALRHHFGEQLRNGNVAQRPFVVALQALQYLCLALRAQHRAILLEVADLLRQRGTLIDEFQQLVIQAINLLAKLFQFFAHAVSGKGKSRTISTPGMAAICAINSTGSAESVSTSV